MLGFGNGAPQVGEELHLLVGLPGRFDAHHRPRYALEACTWSVSSFQTRYGEDPANLHDNFHCRCEPPWRSRTLVSSWNYRMTNIMSGGTPMRVSTCHRRVRSTILYAFQRSMKHMKSATPAFHPTFCSLSTTDIREFGTTCRDRFWVFFPRTTMQLNCRRRQMRVQPFEVVHSGSGAS